MNKLKIVPSTWALSRWPLSSLLSISSDYSKLMVEPSCSEHSHKIPIHTPFYYLYLGGYLVRFFISAIVLNLYPPKRDYFRYDLLFDLFVQLNFLDGKLAIVLWPAVLLLIYLDYTVHFRRGLFSFQLVHELIVINRRNFLAANAWINWLVVVKIVTQRQYQKEVLPNIKLSTEQLASFPQLHHSARCRAVLLSYALDLLLALFVVVFGLIGCFCVYYYYVFIVWPRYSLGQSLVILLDGSLVVYTIWHSAKIIVYLIYALHLLIYVITARQAVMTTAVQALTAASFQRKVAQVQLAAYLPAYIRWQLRMVHLLLTTNREIVSPLLLLAMVTMFGANVYATTMLVLKSLPTAQKMLLLVVCGLQSFFVLLAMRPMIMVVQSLYSSCRHLHRAQLPLGQSYLSLKIKLFTLNEVLTGGEKFTYTVGPVGKITTNALFEFFFVYSSFLLFSFSSIISSKDRYR